MSEHNDSPRSATAPFAEAADAYAKFWSGFTTKMAAAAFAAPPGSTPPDAAREIRAAMLKAMSESIEQYMRTPQFQETLKQWFASSVQYRSQMNEWLSRMRHEMQGVSRQDVDAIIQVMGRMETRLSERLDTLSERLDALNRDPKPATPEQGSKPRKPAAAHPKG